MSQAGINNTSSGPVPPSVPTSFVTDSGTAVPAANILNVLGAGGVTTAGSGNTVTITFSETTVSGTGTTVGATTADIITVSPTDLKAFSVQGLVVGYDTANTEMLGGEVIGNGRKNVTVTIVGTPDVTRDEDAGLVTGSFTIVASGANFILRVTGVAGRTIQWKAVINYIVSP